MNEWDKNKLRPKAPVAKKPSSIVEYLQAICDKLDQLIELNTPAEDET